MSPDAQQRILDFAEALKACKDNAHAEQILKRALSTFGFDRFIYGFIPYAEDGSLGEYLCQTNVDGAWMKRYADNRMYATDYAVWHVVSRPDALRWSSMSQLSNSGALPASFYQTFACARDAGLGTGITCQIAAQGVFRAGMSFVGDRATSHKEIDETFDHNGEEVMALAHMFHAYIDLQTFAQRHYKLAPREREVLRWLADGKQFDAIADKIGTSVSTLEKQARSLRNKMNAATNAQAVAKGVSVGFVGS